MGLDETCGVGEGAQGGIWPDLPPSAHGWPCKHIARLGASVANAMPAVRTKGTARRAQRDVNLTTSDLLSA
jgi:hypothetical protein